jgi:hypothetical protein
MTKLSERGTGTAKRRADRLSPEPASKGGAHEFPSTGLPGIDRTLLFLDATREAGTVIMSEIANETPEASRPDWARLALRVRSVINELEASSLQALVDASPVRRVAPAKAALEARAIEAVLKGTEWLTASEVGRRHKSDAVNLHGSVSRWQKEGKVFSILHSGVRLYPTYLFDELGNPLPAVQAVLNVFDGYLPFRIASWFESTSGMLGGKRPRQVIATDPQAVVAAAADHVVGAVHG